MRICNGEKPQYNRSLFFGLKSPRRFFISLYGDALQIGQLFVALGPSDQSSRTLQGAFIYYVCTKLSGFKIFPSIFGKYLENLRANKSQSFQQISVIFILQKFKVQDLIYLLRNNNFTTIFLHWLLNLLFSNPGSLLAQDPCQPQIPVSPRSWSAQDPGQPKIPVIPGYCLK